MIADIIAPFLPWLIAAAGIIATVVAAWFGGQATGESKTRTSDAKADAKAGKDAKDIRHDLDTSDDAYLIDVLSGKLRDNDKR